VTAKLTWTHGGEAEIVAIGADTVTLVSSVPSPPGSRIEGTLVEGDAKVKVKIHASKKQDDGSFRLEGRPLDMTRELRERLVASVGNTL
jgi:hypothetical protein